MNEVQVIVESPAVQAPVSKTGSRFVQVQVSDEVAGQIAARLQALDLHAEACCVQVLLRDRTAFRAGLEELLDVAERFRGGDTKLDPERWYAARDYALHVLDTETAQQSTPRTVPGEAAEASDG